MQSKIVIFIDWFYPAFKAGGPIKSIFNLISNLSSEFDFYIITSNQDLDGSINEVGNNILIKNKNYSIIYLDKAHQNGKSIKTIIHQINPDVLYYNSLFSIRFTLLPYLFFRNNTNIKHIIAPRGMLGAGALAIKSFKKHLFLKASQLFLFRKNLVWHASTIDERGEILKLYPKASVFVALNISSAITDRRIENSMKEENMLKLVFISRISKKKNLLFMLEIFGKLEKELNIQLNIFGPTEDPHYWKKCKAIIDSDERISYCGLLRPEEISTTLQKHHLYVLPTLSENYGHTIIEAITAGVPVLISDQTPWKKINEANIGEDLPLSDQQPWLRTILKFYNMDQSNYNDLIKSCFSFSRKRLINEQVLEQNKRLLQTAINSQ